MYCFHLDSPALYDKQFHTITNLVSSVNVIVGGSLLARALAHLLVRLVVTGIGIVGHRGLDISSGKYKKRGYVVVLNLTVFTVYKCVSTNIIARVPEQQLIK